MSDTAASCSDAFVNQLLLEAGMDDDGQLRPALMELRALADATPEPSAAVAALMAPAGVSVPQQAPTLDEVPPADEPRADELAARRRAKRRLALTTLSLAVSLSAGSAVAAASDQGIRESFTQLGHSITSFVTGSGGAPAGNQAEEPAVPIPANPAGPATAPRVPSTAPDGELPAAPHPGGAPASETVPGHAGQGRPDAPASSTLPTAVPEDLADGLSRPPVPVPGPSDIPLPRTLPPVPLP